MDARKGCKKNLMLILLLVVSCLTIGFISCWLSLNIANTSYPKTYKPNPLKELELPENYTYINIANTGSMYPTLGESNQAICDLKPKLIRKGDIIVFKDHEGDYVIHRVFKAFPGGYQTISDRSKLLDKKISSSQVYCKVIGIVF